MVSLLGIGRQIGAHPTAMILFSTPGARLASEVRSTVVRIAAVSTPWNPFTCMIRPDRVMKVEELWDLRAELYVIPHPDIPSFLKYVSTTC